MSQLRGGWSLPDLIRPSPHMRAWLFRQPSSFFYALIFSLRNDAGKYQNAEDRCHAASPRRKPWDVLFWPLSDTNPAACAEGYCSCDLLCLSKNQLVLKRSAPLLALCELRHARSVIQILTSRRREARLWRRRWLA